MLTAQKLKYSEGERIGKCIYISSWYFVMYFLHQPMYFHYKRFDGLGDKDQN